MATNQTGDTEDEGDDDSGQGKRGRRSPNYPSLTFTDALARARKIFDKEGRNPVQPEVAVQHLGYSKLNGASFPVIAAIKRYNLMEPTGKGKDLRITDDARFILVHTEGAERDARIAKLAMSPALFHEVLKECPDGLGSDESLRGKLRYKWDFASDAAANTFIRALREAVRLRDAVVADQGAGADTAGDSIKENPVNNPPAPAMNKTVAPPAGGSPPPPNPPARQPHDPEAVARRWEISEGRFATIALPPDPTVEDMEALDEYLALLKMEVALVWKKRKARAAQAPGTPDKEGSS